MISVYAKNIGVDIDNLYISQPDNGEQALELTDAMVRSGAIDIWKSHVFSIMKKQMKKIMQHFLFVSVYHLILNVDKIHICQF